MDPWSGIIILRVGIRILKQPLEVFEDVADKFLISFRWHQDMGCIV